MGRNPLQLKLQVGRWGQGQFAGRGRTRLVSRRLRDATFWCQPEFLVVVGVMLGWSLQSPPFEPGSRVDVGYAEHNY